MKKTLTVNLGGTVFHIDEDAYKLLDEYLNNLRIYFRKQEGAQEIVNDIEYRISELFAEKIDSGSQVISIEYVEEVIERVGHPEELAGVGSEATSGNKHGQKKENRRYARKRLFRNPDDKVLGGVISGMAAYLGWDVTLLRLIVLVVLVCGVGTLIPVYIVFWLLIPEAITAEEKLSMRGEEVTVENIGKTVKDGFEKVSTGVNDYIKSGKPRTALQQVGDALVKVAGLILKVCLIIFAIIISPVLFVLAIVFVALIIAVIAAVIGGGAVLYEMLPAIDWGYVSGDPVTSLVTSICGIIMVGIPLAGLVFVILRQVFNWKPMATGLKWTLIILWFVGVILFLLGLSQLNWMFPWW